jgi:hypothetical protein
MDVTGMDLTAWRRSSRSGGRNCVEVTITGGSKEGSDYVITMRDSKHPEGPTLVFTPAEWEAFVAGVRDGEFDLDETGALVGLDDPKASE